MAMASTVADPPADDCCIGLTDVSIAAAVVAAGVEEVVDLAVVVVEVVVGGHGWRLQVSGLDNGGHAVPPFWGLVVMIRYALRVPPEHETVQAPWNVAAVT